MKKSLYTLLLLINIPTFACDVCSTYDFSQDQSNTFVGLFRQYSFFSGYNNLSSAKSFQFNQYQARPQHAVDTKDYIINPSNNDYESTLTHSLFINHNIKNKFLLQLSIPYTKSVSYLNQVFPLNFGQVQDTLVSTQGLGDIKFSVYKTLLINKKKVKHRLNYGVGLSIPTGRFDLREKNDFVDIRHLPGTGVWSFSPRIQYFNSINSTFGISALALYNRSSQRKTTSSVATGTGKIVSKSGQYRFGDVVSLQTLAYYTIHIYQLSLIPKVGIQFTNEAQDIFQGEMIKHTGVSLTEGILGAEVRYKHLGLRFNYLKPLSQSIKDKQSLKVGAYQVGLYYNFGEAQCSKN